VLGVMGKMYCSSYCSLCFIQIWCKFGCRVIPIKNCICLLLRSLLYHFFIVDYLDNCFQVINLLELISAQEDP
jgi:hypothetical protein